MKLSLAARSLAASSAGRARRASRPASATVNASAACVIVRGRCDAASRFGAAPAGHHTAVPKLIAATAAVPMTSAVTLDSLRNWIWSEEAETDLLTAAAVSRNVCRNEIR